ncbi:GNAT family N-acetyltransferase [Sungkyunkwania multivorans]|uniref:GNAT family N-acetyltransferase n=1 Tax=Sungkyunkwania multivorans TaxID=1173618 RepID=A0ABW3D189_9FLAO
MTVFAETERLLLRALTLDDTNSMFELDSDPIVHRYLGNKPVRTKEEVIKYINYIQMQYENYHIGRWAVIEKASGDFVGWSGLKNNFEHEMNGHTNFIDVGYRLIPRYWGKGYATESGIAAVNYGFETMNYDVIYGMTELDHHASRKALEKIGLTYVEDFVFEVEDLPLTWYQITNPYRK